MSFPSQRNFIISNLIIILKVIHYDFAVVIESFTGQFYVINLIFYLPLVVVKLTNNSDFKPKLLEVISLYEFPVVIIVSFIHGEESLYIHSENSFYEFVAVDI